MEDDDTVQCNYKCYDFTMMSCIWGNDWEGALRVFKRLEGAGFEPTRKTTLNIANILIDHKQYDLVDEVIGKYKLL